MRIFLLSIFRQYVEAIMAGEKQWELRQNPRFGRAGGSELAIGDYLFLVATGGEAPGIPCFARVEEIVRGEEYEERFGSSHPDFKTAVRLLPTTLDEAIPAGSFRRISDGTAWSGRGFHTTRSLRRYRVEGETPERFLRSVLGRYLEA